MKKKTKKKDLFPQKGLIILRLDNEITITGRGYIQATKTAEGKILFTGILLKDYK